MNRSARFAVAALAANLLHLLAGCGLGAFGTRDTAQPAISSSPEPMPHVLNDLSSLSPANPLESAGKSAPITVRTQAAGGPSDAVWARHSAMGTVRHVGTEERPGKEELLNQKAAKFERLSMRVMDQLFEAMQRLEDEEWVARLRLPSNLRPAVVTATLDHTGNLRELLLEQHSGQSAVDRMVLLACRSGLYIKNPVPEAMTPDGGYRVRVEAWIENFGSRDQRRWTFKTNLGLAIL